MKNKYIIELIDGTKIHIGNNRDDFGKSLNSTIIAFQNYPNMYINLSDNYFTETNYFVKGNSVIAIYEDKEKEIINE